jgi:luciferase family oxidoreductase group 1
MPMTLPLSVLDQAPISQGMTGGQALRNSVDLAQCADQAGYRRYWVAEHHGTPMLACASPEALIGPIASATSRLRVGSGGVMLPHYSPLKVAETFSMLSGLYPERIDLALGRAAGTDSLTAYMLQRDRRHPAPDNFPEQLVELLALVRDGFPDDHRFRRLALLPGRAERPSPWLLGSSPQSGIWAAELGLPYAFADFINPNGAEIARRYRASFVPNESQRSPYVIAAVSAVCGESDEEAERLASSSRMTFTLFLQGEFIQVPPVDVAVRFVQDRPDDTRVLARHRRSIVGGPKTVRAQVEAVAAEYQADEVMIVTITYDHAARRRSYELLAGAFAADR